MTSQSPRIYTYKITFEEAPYYYYGVHKEKRFDEEYFGTPVTNRWCWELYTPKKQILEVFEYSDDGWGEANKVEKRLIKPFYNADKCCLNAHCAGVIALKILREVGKMNYKNKLGVHGQSKEQMIENGSKTGKMNAENKTGICGRSKEKMTEDGKKGGKIGGKIAGKIQYENKIGIHGRTKEQMIEDGRRCGYRTYELGIGVHGQSKEQMIENSRKGGKLGGKTTSSQKWMCLETGFITNAGSLSGYQKARGIDISKRKRVS
jgi:hypothetical protein